MLHRFFVARLLVALSLLQLPAFAGSLAQGDRSFETPLVAPDSQGDRETRDKTSLEPASATRPAEERWLSRPLSVGVTAMLATPSAANPILFTGVDVDYALPYLSLNATLGYLNAVNASVAARGRLDLWRGVALNAGARLSLAPLDSGCGPFASLGEGPCTNSTWDHALFALGEFGVEGRTRGGFVWRTDFGLGGLLARGAGSCRSSNRLPCQVDSGGIGLIATQHVTLGSAF